MFKNKLRNYDNPRDTHGFYDDNNQPLSVARLVESAFCFVAVVSALAVLCIAFL